MFNWFKKTKMKETTPNFDFEDTIEETLWEMKQEYDLETEEVERTILETRENLEYIRKRTKNKIKWASTGLTTGPYISLSQMMNLKFSGQSKKNV